MDKELIDEVIKNFFTASAITAACIYVMKKLFDTFVASRLENKKQKIKNLAEYESRKRVEIERWANPLLSAINGLIGRLNHIVNEEGYKELKNNAPQYQYYMPSTLYYFSQYLCWVQILKEEVNYEIFNGIKEEKDFFTSLKNVNKALRDYDIYVEILERGKPVYSLQQRQIAEVMMSNEDSKRHCMSYFEFEKKWQEPQIQNIVKPLKELLNDLDIDSLEFIRLQNILRDLYLAKKEAKKILKIKAS